MESGSILRFLENKAILVTGGAGFLAKVFVEKILRTEPNVKKLYVLLRATHNESASLRFQYEVKEKELFRVLKRKMGANFEPFISEKIRVVEGDTSRTDLGIKDTHLKDELLGNLDIIVNLAATTSFDERYDVALCVNTFGAKNVLDFAMKCPDLKVFVQVSTAYVSGEMIGLIKENPYDMGHALNGRSGLDIELEKQLVHDKLKRLQDKGATDEITKLTMKNMGMKRAKHWGWPNVYEFTKALGEMVLMQQKGDIPLVLIRPTIVTSTFKEPFPGWIEGLRTVDSLIAAFGKGKLTHFPVGLESIIDLIPADIVVNAMIVAMEAQANRRGDPTIYHVGSSRRNQLKLGMFPDIAYEYFTHNPLTSKDGNPIIVSKMKIFNSMASFKRFFYVRYKLPLKGFKIVNVLSCQYFQDTYMDLRQKINRVMRLVDIYKPYLFFTAIYDDGNLEKLRIGAKDRGVETDIFYFDPTVFDWGDYIFNIHFPGLVKYVVKL